MAIHTIRLRGPWQCESLDRAGNVIAAGEFDAPGSWRESLDEHAAAVRLRRRFNRPTGLGEDRVTLVIESCSLPMRLDFNGQPVICNVTEVYPLRVDITTSLRPHNEVTLTSDRAISDLGFRISDFELSVREGELGLVTLEIGPARR